MNIPPQEAHPSSMRLEDSIAMGTDLHRAIDALPGLMWTASADGRIDFVNQRWCEYTGLLQADRWLQAVHPDDHVTAAAAWQRCLDAGCAGDTEARMRRRDGVYRWFLLHISPVRDEYGHILDWCGLGTDIDDYKSVGTASLIQSFRRVVDSLPTPIVLVKPEGRILHDNRE